MSVCPSVCLEKFRNIWKILIMFQIVEFLLICRTNLTLCKSGPSNKKAIINYGQQDATILDLFISSPLYMFRAIPSPIIRST
jgi:hypothetical protein